MSFFSCFFPAGDTTSLEDQKVPESNASVLLDSLAESRYSYSEFKCPIPPNNTPADSCASSFSNSGDSFHNAMVAVREADHPSVDGNLYQSHAGSIEFPTRDDYYAAFNTRLDRELYILSSLQDVEDVLSSAGVSETDEFFTCYSCGVNWSLHHITLDCQQCGGYSLTRPCPRCHGRCGAIWNRDPFQTHSVGKAQWQGKCKNEPQDEKPNSGTLDETTKKMLDEELDKVLSKLRLEKKSKNELPNKNSCETTKYEPWVDDL